MKAILKFPGLLFLIILCLLLVQPVYAYDSMIGEYTYIFNNEGADVIIPDAYTFERTVHLLDFEGKAAKDPKDMYITPEGSIYVLDSEGGQIFILDKAYKTKAVIHRFTMPDGSTTILNKPEGIFVASDGRIYIADTQNHRIIVCNQNGMVLQSFGKPKDMTGVEEEDKYYPTKIVLDSAMRIYVVARNINMGILELDGQGVFLGYIGAPIVKPDLFTQIWRKMSTKAQRDRMMELVPTEYSNIAIDGKNFIYGTISSLKKDDCLSTIQSRDKSGKITPIRKLNSMGQDVLSRKGAFPPIGDLVFRGEPSRIEDVALGQNGVYSLMDFTRGRIFTYDFDGNLLFAFGNKGSKKGNFQSPAAIGYQGDKLVVLDSVFGEFMVYKTTEYGQIVLDAVRAQFLGNYDTANKKWGEAAQYCSNFEYAYDGLGEAHLSVKQYKEAMECFRYADDKQNYSNAYELERKASMKKSFTVICTVLMAVVALWLVWKLGRNTWRYFHGYYDIK